MRAGDATLRARAALTHLVDTLLRDGDMVALVKPLDPLHAITFTQDRALIRQVIAAFEGHAGDYTPRTEFERNFMSRDPKTAEATRAQVVSAALQSLARRLGEQQPGRKALIFVSEGFRPAQPRAIVYAANRNGVAFYPLDPNPEPADDESMLRSIAEQTGGAASINDADLAPAIAQARCRPRSVFRAQLSRPRDRPTADFIRCRCASSGRDAQARSRSGYWAPDAALAAAARESGGDAADGRLPAVPLEPVHSAVDRHVARARWADERDGHVGAGCGRRRGISASRRFVVKATANDGTVLFESRVGAGDVDRATFNAPPGYIALEMAIQSSSGAALDTDYRGISVPNLQVTRPTFATPQVLRTRTARDFAETSQNADAVPVASRTFSRTERLLIRVPAYGPDNSRSSRHRAPAEQAGHPHAPAGGRRRLRCRLGPSSSTSPSRRSRPTNTASSWRPPTRPGPGTKPRKCFRSA